MHICPVCGKENTSLQCAVCGFDMSRDYEGYPTLAPLKAGLPSRAAAGKNLKDMHRCKDCGGLLFYLNPVKGVCVCAKCGQEVPIGVPKPQPTPVPTPPAKPAAEKVITYDAYMRALEQKYLDNGKQALSPAQIDIFLRENQLDKRFDIYFADICKDLETIYAKHNPPKTPVPTVTAIPKDIIDYDTYMRSLEQKFLDNGKQFLSPAQIDTFLRENQLGKRFHIHFDDICKDLETIYAKYKPQNAPKQIANYEDYMRALEALYVKNGKQSLSPEQIRDFILTNNLGKKFGITIPDVQKDLKPIAEKHKLF